MSLHNLLADDRGLIVYRPKLNEVTTSVTSTILLQQILYWYKKTGYKPFYKFKEPCQHESYTGGDSWCEELGFTKSEFDSALKKIGQKLKKGTKKENFLIYYWNDMSRKTYYEVNIFLLEKQLNMIYENQDLDLRKEEKLIYENQESGFMKSDNHDLYIQRLPETNTETTTDIISEIEKLDISDFLKEKFIEWYKYKVSIKDKLKTMASFTKMMNQLGKDFLDEKHLADSIDQSIMCQYKGVFPKQIAVPKDFGQNKKTTFSIENLRR